MNIDTPCPQCGTIFTVRRELLGKRTKCTRCGAAFTIAEVVAVPSTPPPAVGKGPAPEPPPASLFAEISTPPPEITPLPQINVEPAARSISRPVQAQESLAFRRSAAEPSFTVLRWMARSYEILAVLALAFAVIAMIVFAITIIRNPTNVLAELVNLGVMFFSSMLFAVSLLAFAQTIRLALAIEQNTRHTQQACRQLADHLGAIETEP
jgi:hypothetical protein